MLVDKREVQLEMLMPVIKEKLNLGAEVNLISSGNSMCPLFHHRKDTVCLKQAVGSDVKKYDMILYQRDNGKYVLHRVVGNGPEGFILRGDNQYENEYPIREDQVIAKVCGFSRNGGNRVSCENIRYRMYAVLWVNTAGLRRMFSKIKRFPRRAVRKLYRILVKGGR